jgi:RND family efflux transporter MFP subunit
MRFRLGFRLVVAVFTACGAVLLPACGKKADARIAKGEAPPARTVRLVPAEMRPMDRVITVTGTLAAQEHSVLSAKVPGRLQQLTVDIGSVVKKGDLLAQIEPRDYELGVQQAAAALAQSRAAVGLPPDATNDVVPLEEVTGVRQAQAVLDEATKNRDRIRSLSQSGIAAQSEMDTVEAAFAVAQTRYATSLEEARTRLATVAERRADLELALKRLSDASLRAPFDGTVQGRPASIGEYVAAGTPTVELVKTDPLRLRLRVPERDSSLVRVGQPVRLWIEGDTNQFPGVISRLSPALDESTRMLLVEADVPQKGVLRPGLFVRAQVVVGESQPSLSVPSDALVTFAGIQKVVVVSEGKAVEKVISTGRRGPGWVEVLSGLAAGEHVVMQPSGLRTGNPVLVAEPQALGDERLAAGRT